MTGGAGFIGSNVADRLLADGHTVRVLDNMSTGRQEFNVEAIKSANFELVQGDILNEDVVDTALQDVDIVIHLAANADIRFGWMHPRRDLEQNVIMTYNILEGMRRNRVRRLLFSSTGSVYGRPTQFPTPENCEFPIQTSLYGASKASAEGFIAAYSEAGIVSATIFRFVSILGPRYSHGHVYDFVQQLRSNTSYLSVLGDGNQRKSYLHVYDCANAIASRLEEDPGFEVLNLGTNEYCTINDSVGWITDQMGLDPTIEFAGGSQGWVGDNPFIFLDISRMLATSWSPQFSIEKSVKLTVDWLLENSWVFE